jgi:hypothetical protein
MIRAVQNLFGRVRTGVRGGSGSGGGGGFSSIVTFNPADKDAAITLSNNNLTATCMTGADRNARTTGLSRTDVSGQFFFEMHCDAIVNDVCMCVGNSSAPLGAQWISGGANGVIYQSNGFFGYNGGATGSLTTFGVGDTMGMVWNAATNVYKVYKNGTLVYTSAACPITGAKFAAFSGFGFGNTNPDTGTFNFGGSTFAFPVTGTTSWDGQQSL